MTSESMALNVLVPCAESFQRETEAAVAPDPLAFSVARVLLVAGLIGAPWAFGAVITWAWMALGLVACLALFLWATGSVWQARLEFVWSPLYVPLAMFFLLGLAQYWGQLPLDRSETRQALVLLNSALRGSDHTELFRMTESFRAGVEGREKIDNLLRTLYSLLEDLMFLEAGTPQLVRNTDILGELKKLAESTDFAWINRAAQGLGEVERGMRRNLLRSLSLDAFATALERPS